MSAAGLAAGELGDVGVLLLRHDARPGRVAVVERHEAELAGGPEDDLLGLPADVDADHREHERQLGDEVAAGRPVDGVGACCR